MDTPSHLKATATLFGDALSEAAKLFQNELALAKAEIADHVSTISTNIGLLVAGALLLIPALVLLLLALAAVLTTSGGLSPALADLVAGLVGLVLAGALIAGAIARIKTMTLMPERTFQQLRKDRQTITQAAE